MARTAFGTRTIVRSFAWSVLPALFAAESASAQQVTVQQPVVSTVGVQTTVSIPDRGSILLGGVSSAASSRSVYGPFPFRSGSSVGREMQSSSIRAHVWIHDLAAMDEYLLGVDTGRTPPELRPATTARGELMSARSATGRNATFIASPPSTAQRVDMPAGLRDSVTPADGYYRLGLRAEARGDSAVARVHFRMAAQRGSEAARAKLSQIESSNTPRTASLAADEPTGDR